MSVTDQMGNKRNVVTTDGLYNNQGREYWITNKDDDTRSQLYNASDVVVHQIDGVLLYHSEQLSKWQEEIDKLKPADANNARRR